jgi:hypothetical protein
VRRVLLIVIGLGLAAGGVAVAQGQSNQDAYQLQEPHVTSAQVLRLPSDAGCVHFTRATVRFLPPPGAVFGVLTVKANGAEAARMTGVPRAASATIRLARRTEVRVNGTTLGGQVIGASRSYRRCGTAVSKPKPKARPKPKRQPAPAKTPPPVEQGGGEDG